MKENKQDGVLSGAFTVKLMRVVNNPDVVLITDKDRRFVFRREMTEELRRIFDYKFKIYVKAYLMGSGNLLLQEVVEDRNW